MQSRFLIGAASSGSGKTTLTLGFLRALARRGFEVRPFKCGPDYIDTQYHRLAAGCESVNLDLFMASTDHVREIFARYSAQVSVAEGVMGLFDGYDANAGSSAEVARLLDLPVILVVDARKSGYSLAPLLWGYKNFRPSVVIAGVVFNRVSSASHLSFLRDAARDAELEVLGYLPDNQSFSAPSRHLGLSLENLSAFDPTIEAIADAVEKNVDLDRILELSCRPALVAKPLGTPLRPTFRVAIARDEAFSFLYRANLDRLEQLGGELVFFSPLRDSTLPAATDLLYLPGGYPEFYASQLADNQLLRSAVRDFAERGGKILAECGGMLYLGRSLIMEPSLEPFPMCGVLPLDGTMEGMKLHLGYREIHYDSLIFRGHEFHYSRVDDADLLSVARQFSARGEPVSTPLYRYKNVIAGYTHLYWAEGDPMQLFECQ